MRGFPLAPNTEYLIAARGLYEAGGEKLATVRNLAKRVGLSPAALYRSWPTKGDLLSCVGAHVLWDLFTALSRCEAEAPLPRVRSMCDAAVDFWRGNRRIFELVFRGRKRIQVGHEAVRRVVRGVLNDAANERGRDLVHHADLADAWIAMFIGAVAMHESGAFDEAGLRRILKNASDRIVGRY